MAPDIFKKLRWAPVQAFAHAPLKDNWKTDDIVIVDSLSNKNKYWRAKIINTYGYYVEIQWLNSNDSNGKKGSTKIVNFRRQNLLPIVDCERKENVIQREYEPPVSLGKANIMDIFNLPPKYTTLKRDLYEEFYRELNPDFWKNTDVLFECLDFDNPSRLIPCKIIQEFGGWLLIQYERDEENLHNVKKIGTWVHPKSGFIRVCGWSQMVNYPILATESYVKMSYFFLTQEDDFSDKYLINPNLFPFEPDLPNPFEIGSYMEFLDPLSNRMRLVKVYKKIRFGFMVLQYEYFDSRIKLIFQHVTSRLIFPCGFCRINKIPLYMGDNNIIDWKTCPKLQERLRANQAPLKHFPKIEKNTWDFHTGDILEVFLANGFGYINYAIILRIVGRLMSLKLMTRNAQPEFWVECESYMIQPFGFTHLLNWDQISKSNIFIFNSGIDLQKKIKKLEESMLRKVDLADKDKVKDKKKDQAKDDDVIFVPEDPPLDDHPIEQQSKPESDPSNVDVESIPESDSGPETSTIQTVVTQSMKSATLSTPPSNADVAPIQPIVTESMKSDTPSTPPSNADVASIQPQVSESDTGPGTSTIQPIVTQSIKSAILLAPSSTADVASIIPQTSGSDSGPGTSTIKPMVTQSIKLAILSTIPPNANVSMIRSQGPGLDSRPGTSTFQPMVTQSIKVAILSTRPSNSVVASQASTATTTVQQPTSCFPLIVNLRPSNSATSGLPTMPSIRAVVPSSPKKPAISTIASSTVPSSTSANTSPVVSQPVRKTPVRRPRSKKTAPSISSTNTSSNTNLVLSEPVDTGGAKCSQSSITTSIKLPLKTQSILTTSSNSRPIRTASLIFPIISKSKNSQVIGPSIVTVSANSRPISVVPSVFSKSDTNPVTSQTILNTGTSGPSNLKPPLATAITGPPRFIGQSIIGKPIANRPASSIPSSSSNQCSKLLKALTSPTPLSSKGLTYAFVGRPSASPSLASSSSAATRLTNPSNVYCVPKISYVSAVGSSTATTTSASTSTGSGASIIQFLSGITANKRGEIKMQNNTTTPVLLKNLEGTVLLLKPEGINLGQNQSGSGGNQNDQSKNQQNTESI